MLTLLASIFVNLVHHAVEQSASIGAGAMVFPHNLWLIIVLITTAAATRIALDVYYETLCPYSQRFIVEQLTPVMKTDLARHIALRLFPYGNVRVLPTGQYECQHGPEECNLNAIHACAIYYYRDKRLIDFIACNEESTHEVERCAMQYLGPEGFRRIQECIKGPLVTSLIEQVREHSDRQNYTFIPWVVVNGKQSDTAQSDLAKYICDTAIPMPALCLAVEFSEAAKDRAPVGRTYRSTP